MKLRVRNSYIELTISTDDPEVTTVTSKGQITILSRLRKAEGGFDKAVELFEFEVFGPGLQLIEFAVDVFWCKAVVEGVVIENVTSFAENCRNTYVYCVV